MSTATADRPPVRVRALLYMSMPIPAKWRDWGISLVRRDDWPIRSALRQAALMITIFAAVVVAVVVTSDESVVGAIRRSSSMYLIMLIPVVSALLKREAHRRTLLQNLATGRWPFFTVTPMRWWDLPLAFGAGGIVVLLLLLFVGNP